MKFHKNHKDEKFLAEVEECIKNNDGYCCCKIEHVEENKCPCVEFINSTEIGECHCGRFIKEEA